MGQVSFYLILLALALSKLSESERAELARSIKNGDHEAFKIFYEHHHESLYRYLMGKGISEEAARDLVQKAFIYIWEQRQQIDPSKSLQAYLFRIGYTRMLNHIRDNSKFDESEELPVIEDGKNPEDDLRAAELKKAIDRAISDMPEKRGMVFEMCFIQEFTYRETAESLGVSKKTVENHMGLALKDLRAALRQFDPEK
ncbi:RNA polymerase sigma-70 factor [Balneolaceae bacterium YR4-1]|uniref:RNA polymerase sigma-70 factor n=1 Tax=Halalkalibaculum roseum TaxID=2709311 RepID=A0A6M1T9S0_9BACT|nr:RNA polymerase sigma-70 factor [Halalkalibaculum roseum]NGP76973.1 RNA polymerase sigma-70 factor [Halalkalibaculum roseum]